MNSYHALAVAVCAALSVSAQTVVDGDTIKLSGTSDCFGVKSREVDRAMASIDDTLSNLVYEVKTDLLDEIESQDED